MDGQVKLHTQATDEGALLAKGGAPEGFHGNAEDAYSLALFPIVKISGEVIGHSGVVNMGEAIGDLAEVVERIGIGPGVVETEAEAEVLVEEVGVVQTRIEAKAEALGAVCGAKGHGIQATAQSQTCIILVPSLLSRSRESHSYNDECYDDSFHIIVHLNSTII